ncbi:ABC transporter transmembrane domain-containing protein [Endothiovibrio diazotrophicus]
MEQHPTAAPEAPPPTPHLTAVECLRLLARHYGMRIPPRQLAEQLPAADEVAGEVLAGVADRLGFHAELRRLDADGLLDHAGSLPAAARLANGHYVIVVDRLEGEDGVARLKLFDPLARPAYEPRDGTPNYLTVPLAAFAERWSGEALFLTRLHSLFDEARPAGRGALRCLALVGSHHGVETSEARIRHDHALAEGEPEPSMLARIARGLGLKCAERRARLDELPRLSGAFPLVARLTNGNSVIVRGVHGSGEEMQVALLHPFSPLPFVPPVEVVVKGKNLTELWPGKALFMKRAYAAGDERRPFGLGWFLPEILRQRRLFGDVVLAALVMHLIALFSPFFFQLVIDKVLVHHSLSTLHVLAGGLTAALAFNAVLEYLRGFLVLHASSRIDARVGMRTFGHLLRLPIALFERVSAGVLTKHMQQATAVRQFLTGSLFTTALDALALLLFVPILFFYSATLTALVLGFTALIVLLLVGVMPAYRRRLDALYQAEGERQAVLVETIHGMRTVKSLALEPRRRALWERCMAGAVDAHYRVGTLSTGVRALSNLLEKLMSVALIWLGASMVFEGNLSVGALVAFQLLAGRVSGPLVRIASLLHEFQETLLSVRKLATVMDHPPEEEAAGGLRPALRGAIRFEGVVFGYDPATPVLRELTLELPAGTSVGVVGRSGCGKSTLTRLLQGLYRPQRGRVTIAGHDLRGLDLAHLRTRIGVVLQENVLFRGTLRENLAITRPDASLEAIERAARLAGASEFIERLAEGYETPLEEGGNNLSGGQKQRLAIARALLRDPDILIFDEATSALDAESEAIIQRNLPLIAKGRTLLVISHRLASLRGFDAIVVLDEGRVVGMGRHEELLAGCPLYRELWETQNPEK